MLFKNISTRSASFFFILCVISSTSTSFIASSEPQPALNYKDLYQSALDILDDKLIAAHAQYNEQENQEGAIAAAIIEQTGQSRDILAANSQLSNLEKAAIVQRLIKEVDTQLNHIKSLAEAKENNQKSFKLAQQEKVEKYKAEKEQLLKQVARTNQQFQNYAQLKEINKTIKERFFKDANQWNDFQKQCKNSHEKASQGLTKLVPVIQELQQGIKNKIILVDDENESLALLLDILQTIETLNQKTEISECPAHAHLTLQFVKDTAHYLKNVMHEFNDTQKLTLSPFDTVEKMSTVVQSLNAQNSTIEDFLKNLSAQEISNKEVVERLTSTLTNLGLTPFNQNYRALDKSLVQPVKKALYKGYKSDWFNGLYYGSGTLAAALITGSILAPDQTNEVIKKLPDCLSQAVRFTLGKLGYVKPIAVHPHVITTPDTLIHVANTGGAFLLYKLTTECAKPGLKFSGKKINDFHKYLRGSKYNQRRQSDAATVEQLCSFFPATFEDIIGQEQLKGKLKQIPEYVLNPEQFKKSNTPPPTAILLAGGPGSGKSCLAKATMDTTIREYIKKHNTTSISALLNDIAILDVGVEAFSTKEIIQEIIGLKATHKLVLVWIDEMSLGLTETVISNLLQALDGAIKNAGGEVVFLGATSEVEKIREKSEALLREMRLEVLYTQPLVLSEREEYFVRLLGGYIDLNRVDTERLAHLTQDFSGAKIKAIVNESMRIAKSKQTMPSQEIIEKAIHEIGYSLSNNHDALDSHDKMIVAANLVGHAFTLFMLDQTTHLDALRLSPSKDSKQFGHIQTYKISDKGTKFKTVQDLTIEALVALSGKISEELLLDEKSNYQRTDKYNERQAFINALTIELNGRLLSQFSESEQKEIYKQAQNRVDGWTQDIKAALEVNKLKLEMLTQGLVKENSLPSQALFSIIGMPLETIKKLKENVEELVADDMQLNFTTSSALHKYLPKPKMSPITESALEEMLPGILQDSKNHPSLHAFFEQEKKANNPISLNGLVQNKSFVGAFTADFEGDATRAYMNNVRIIQTYGQPPRQTGLPLSL